MVDTVKLGPSTFTTGETWAMNMKHRAHWGVECDAVDGILYVCDEHLVYALVREGVNKVWSLDPIDEAYDCCCPGWY